MGEGAASAASVRPGAFVLSDPERTSFRSGTLGNARPRPFGRPGIAVGDCVDESVDRQTESELTTLWSQYQKLSEVLASSHAIAPRQGHYQTASWINEPAAGE